MGKSSPLVYILAFIVIIVGGTIFYFIPNFQYQAPVEKDQVTIQICPPYCGGIIQTEQVVFTDIAQILGDQNQLSIVESKVTFTESDQNGFEQYLDEEKPLGITASEFFILETSTVLFDSNQNKIPSSSFLDIPFDVPFTTTNVNDIAQTNEQNIIFFDMDNFSKWLSINNYAGSQTNFRKTLTENILIEHSININNVGCEAGDLSLGSECYRLNSGYSTCYDGITPTVSPSRCYKVSAVSTSPPFGYEQFQGFSRTFYDPKITTNIPLILSFDYSSSCSNVSILLYVNNEKFPLNCNGSNKFQADIASLITPTQNNAIQIGGISQNYFKHSVSLSIDNVKLVNGGKVETPSLLSFFDFFNNPSQLSLTDKQGNLLDLGSIQVGFFGKYKTDNDLKVEGTIEFWHDDKKVATQKIFKSPDGTYTKTDELFVDDQVKSITNNPKRAFTFTFADEGGDWVDGSTHTFRVLVKDISAETQSLNERKKFSWSGEFVAYQLVMTVDATKKVVKLSDDDSAISIFKNDNKILACDSTSENATPPVTIIQKSDMKVIAVVDAHKTQSTQNVIYEDNCAIFPELQRSTEYILRMEEKDYNYQTPRIQKNIFVKCRQLVSSATGIVDFAGQKRVGYLCQSDFAKEWEYIFNSISGQRTHINSNILKVCGQDTPTSYTKVVLEYSSRYTIYLESPTFKSPIIKVYDGNNLVGETGGKTYCTILDNLPHNKELRFVVSEYKELRGTIILPTPERTFSIKTATIDDTNHFFVQCYATYEGFWYSKCISNIGYS